MNIKPTLSLLLIFFLQLTVFAQKSENEITARQWIAAHSQELDIQPYHNFKLTFVRKGLAGETLRFQQMLHDVMVYDSEIVVNFNLNNEIAFCSNNYDKTIENININATFSDKEAILVSNTNLNNTNGKIVIQNTKLVVFNFNNTTKLAYRITTQIDNKAGDWETFVDAKTGALLSLKNIAIDFHKKTKKSSKKIGQYKNQKMIPTAFTSGTAMVFDFNPLATSHQSYLVGSNYADNEDATNESLDAARTAVQLPQIDLTEGVYRLRSQYVDIADFELPNKGLFTQTTNNFSFTRDNDGFEAANAFYHLDQSMRYINETLGVLCKPLLNNGVFQFDPSGVNGDDNSHYTPSTNQIAFGEGCVDDAEDADVILHEFGHGIHDWLTGGHSSAATGLGEGCGDYWAMSYSRSKNLWTAAEPAYHYVFGWDGHNECWNGRITNYTKTYPQTTSALTQIHTYGQTWSTSLMKIYDVIGRAKTDKAFLEGLTLTNSSSNQKSAATAVRQAAINMNYACADIQVMTDKFNAAGYTLAAVPLSIKCPATQNVNVNASGTYSVPNFSNLSNAISANCAAIVTQTPAIGANLVAGTYSVSMTATGATAVSCNFSLVVSGALAVDQVVKIKNFAMYPNPALSILTISGEFQANESISVFNLLGQKMLEKVINSKTETIDVSKLTSGIYILYFKVSKTVEKFVKQ